MGGLDSACSPLYRGLASHAQARHRARSAATSACDLVTRPWVAAWSSPATPNSRTGGRSPSPGVTVIDTSGGPSVQGSRSASNRPCSTLARHHQPAPTWTRGRGRSGRRPVSWRLRPWRHPCPTAPGCLAPCRRAWMFPRPPWAGRAVSPWLWQRRVLPWSVLRSGPARPRPAPRRCRTGVGCGKERNDTLSTSQRLFGHLYSPVSRMWPHPRGEVCVRVRG